MEYQAIIEKACGNAMLVTSNGYNERSYLDVLRSHIAVNGDMILALTELFQLIKKANEKKHIEVLSLEITQSNFERGVYFCKSLDMGFALTDIPKGLFKYIAYDSAGSITKSPTGSSLFDNEFGSYLIFFTIKNGFVHPNCYSYFIKSNEVDKITPFESFSMSNEINGYWVEEAISFINKNCGTNIHVQETEKFMEKI